ncbi:MAG: hypothetical protein CLLPBCKN_005814 [Chroococcidiopsis cubana SAG 39.79]|nr:hypothetical protein [Chroococcidiopsis cubana SAG 39.79]
MVSIAHLIFIDICRANKYSHSYKNIYYLPMIENCYYLSFIIDDLQVTNHQLSITNYQSLI